MMLFLLLFYADFKNLNFLALKKNASKIKLINERSKNINFYPYIFRLFFPIANWVPVNSYF